MDNHDFGSLYHPENQEVATAKRQKSHYTQRLAEVEEQIHRLQEEATFLNSGMSRCDQVLAPFRLASDDVLREIFLRCLPLEENSPRWRLVVLDCHSFWKYIHLRFQEKTFGDAEGAQRIGDILKQSTRPPFDLRITWEWGRYLGRDIFTSVGKSMTGPALHSIPLLTLISLPSGLFPNLARLCISCERPQGWDNVSGRWYSIEAFNDAPSLRQVAHSSWFFERSDDIASIDIALPWPQLTVIHNQEINYANTGTQYFLVRHLPHCANLRYLRFALHTSPIEIAPWSQLPTTRLPNMEGLCMELGGTDFPSGLNFLSKLDLPNLTSLRLEGYEWKPLVSSVLNPLEDKRVHSKFQNLVHLSIQFSRLSSSVFDSIIHSLPNVETLDLDSGRWTYSNINEHHPLYLLEWSPANLAHRQRSLPRLRTLILHPFTLGENPFAHGCLNRVIRSRMSCDLPGDGVSLKKVVIYPQCPVNREEVIQEYIDLGRLEFEEDTAAWLYWVGSKAWMKDDPALCDWPEIQQL